jgi:hypothetical protein
VQTKPFPQIFDTFFSEVAESFEMVNWSIQTAEGKSFVHFSTALIAEGDIACMPIFFLEISRVYSLPYKLTLAKDDQATTCK